MSQRRAAGLVGALVVGALGVAGCAGYTGTPSQMMHEWANNAGYVADDQQIEADLTSLAAGLRSRQLKALHTACDAFVIDANTLYDELPTPDGRATDELSTGLTDLASAGTACSLAPSFSSPTFARYERLLKEGVASFDVARKRITSFGVS